MLYWIYNTHSHTHTVHRQEHTKYTHLSCDFHKAHTHTHTHTHAVTAPGSTCRGSFHFTVKVFTVSTTFPRDFGKEKGAMQHSENSQWHIYFVKASHLHKRLNSTKKHKR